MDEEEAAITVGLGLLARKAAAFEYTLHGLAANLRAEPRAYAYKGSRDSARDHIDACLVGLANGNSFPASSEVALAHDLEMARAHLDERNRFIHGRWVYDSERQSWLTIKASRAKDAKRPEIEYATSEDVWGLAAEFGRLDLKLAAWDATYFGVPGVSEDGEFDRASVKRL
ncbi:hypothetical protein [Streptomyces niveus]|uniref:hypothetical protein n=1 Tax=Streptomyces niveus TaxID=193462 RepID=UPI0034295994